MKGRPGSRASARERIPPSLVTKNIWNERFADINAYEHYLSRNGVVIRKFFLHISKKEQKRRFLERIDDPGKNWKFSLADLEERGYWDHYQKAYEEAISATSTDYAPWFIIPADDKWFARLAIASVIHHHFDQLDLTYPTVTGAQRAELQRAKKQLLGEKKKVFHAKGAKKGRKGLAVPQKGKGAQK